MTIGSRSGRALLPVLVVLAACAAARAADAPAGPWGAAADPLDTKVKVPPSPNVDLTVIVKGHGEPVRSNRAGAFLAIQDNDMRGDAFELIDLAFGKKSGRLMTGNLKNAVISPDGQFLAGAGEWQAAGTCEVWSFQTGKQLKSFKVSPNKEDFGIAGFAVNDRLVTTLQVGFTTKIAVWDTKTGAKAYEFEVDEWLKSPPAITPGGKFLAVADKQDVQLHDLAAGKMAAKFPKPRNQPNGRDPAGVKQLAFSPDGTMLAGNFEGFFKTVLAVWDMKDGKALHEHMVEPIDSGWGPHLIWLADGSGWILGKNVVDRASGKVVHTLDTGDDVAARFPLTADVLVSVYKPQAGKVSIKSAKLPRADIDKAVATVKSGGQAIDAGLPPLTPADWSSAKEIKPADQPLKAPLQPDAAPKFARRFSAAPITFKLPAAAGKTEVNTRGILFAARNTGHAIAVHDVRDTSQFGVNDKFTRVWFDRIDLSAGTILNSVELPPVAEVLDLSADGTLAAVRLGPDRIDIWSTEGAGKQVAGFRPFEKEENKDHRKVAWAAIIDAKSILVASEHGKLALFSLPKCQGVWTMKFEWMSHPAVSPGRKYGAILTNAGPAFFETATGNPLGTLPGTNMWLGRLSFSPDGDRLAAAAAPANNSQLTVYDLKAGTLLTHLVLPKGVRQYTFNWFTPNYCLIGHEFLIDLDKGIPLWRYTPAKHFYSSQQPDDSTWWFITPEQDKLASAQLPHDEARKALAAAKPEDLFAARPGAKVSLEINIGHTTDESRQKITDALTKRLQANGYTVADGQPLHLVATVATAPGREIEYRHIGVGGVEKVQTTDFDSQLSFTLDGQSIWEVKEKTNNGQFMVSLKQGQTAADAVNSRNAELGLGLFLSPPLPKFLLKPSDKPTLGASRLTAKGIEPQ